MDGTGFPKSGMAVRIRPRVSVWATSVPGARLSYKQQDRVQLLGCLPRRRIRPVAKSPGLHPGKVGSIPTCGTNALAARLDVRQITNLEGGGSNPSERANSRPAPRRQAGLLIRPIRGKHLGGSPMASAMDATNRPKVRPLRSNRSEVANRARSPKVGGSGFKSRTVFVRVEPRAPSWTGGPSGEGRRLLI